MTIEVGGDHIVITNAGSDFYDSAGTRYSLEKFDALLEGGARFRVIRKSDGKNITGRVIDRVRRKVWRQQEIDLLKERYGLDTLRELGDCLPLKSQGQIRHMASKLGLTQDKTWTDKELSALAALRKSGVASHAIAEILGRPRRAVEVKISNMGLAKGNATGGRVTEALQQTLDAVTPYLEMDPLTKGKIAEDFVSIDLMKRGIDVFTPYKPNHKTDLIAIHDSGLCRLQVKSAVWEASTGRFRVPLMRKDPRSHKRIHYDASDVDFFMLVCLGLNVTYVVPYAVCKDKKEAHLYPHRAKKAQGNFDWEIYREAFGLISARLAPKS